MDKKALEIFSSIYSNDYRSNENENSDLLILETEKDLKIIRYFLNAMLTANNDAWIINPNVEKQIDVIEEQKAM